jgi:pimeloyl-ACP methyl ester carboxylesterase
MTKKIIVLLVLCTLIVVLEAKSATKLPIVYMHGLTGSSHDFDQMANWTSELGYPSYSLNGDSNLASLFNRMEDQLVTFINALEQTKKQYKFKEHYLICHSQGTLLCRAYLQTYQHDVQVFISLSGPHMGQFGLPAMLEKYVPFLRFWPVQDMHSVLYSSIAQKSLSFANYWKDPYHYTLYQEHVSFLPFYNSELPAPDPKISNTFKSNFLRLKKAVFTGSPDDAVIQPYFSALFSFWEITDSSDSPLVQIPMEKQTIYTSDLFGLKTMKEEGRLFLFDVPGVQHLTWLSDKKLFERYILPFLQ